MRISDWSSDVFFRSKGDRVIHSQHIFTSQDAPFFAPDSEGTKINPVVAPRDGETVVVKNFPNSFLKTDLKQILDADGIGEVVVVGAMSHMCIDATTRAASDYGYKTTVVQDACATRDLEFGRTETRRTGKEGCRTGRTRW